MKTWYASYADVATPVVAAAFDRSGALVGFFPLSLFEGRLTGAGAYQAEYQTWLALPESSEWFAPRAVAALKAAYPDAVLTLKYVPTTAPIRHLLAAPAFRAYTETTSHRRPLMQLGPELTSSLRKKSNASRLNRLKHLGATELHRIDDSQSLEQCFDEIIDIYDFRQAALNNAVPFREDGRKRLFHLAWMAAAPEDFHVTVLRAGTAIVSALLGIVGRDAVHVAIIAHSPFFARHSPGKLHLMLAGLQLTRAGVKYIDLTPGGAWKDRFADAYDSVIEVTVRPTIGRARAARARNTALRVIKRALVIVGIEVRDLRRAAAIVTRARISSATKFVRQWLRDDAELRLYVIDPMRALHIDAGAEIRKNDIPSLLKYEPFERWQSRQAFMVSALSRLEATTDVFTITDGSHLLHYGWLEYGQTKATFTEVDQVFAFPQATAVLYDFYTAPAARGRGYYQQTLSHMLRELARAGVRTAFICVLADNAPSRRVIEKLGFRYVGSLWRRRRCGRTTKWSTVDRDRMTDQ